MGSGSELGSASGGFILPKPRARFSANRVRPGLGQFNRHGCRKCSVSVELLVRRDRGMQPSSELECAGGTWLRELRRVELVRARRPKYILH
jgi:hypothetical protein